MLKQNIKIIKVSTLLIMTLCMPLSSLAKNSAPSANLKQELQTFSIKTDSTRLIYNPSSNGQSLAIENPQNYPILVQTTVLDADKKTPAPFFVTPPLFRLDANKKNIIHIMSTGQVAKPDRESLYWLCLQAIPPEDNSVWDNSSKSSKMTQSTLLTQMRIKTCLKVLVRPNSLKGTPSDVADQLKWSLNGNILTINNPTPFYMNFKNIKINNQNITAPSYVAPFSTKTVKIQPNIKGNTVSWTIITDYGGESQQYQAPLTQSNKK